MQEGEAVLLPEQAEKRPGGGKNTIEKGERKSRDRRREDDEILHIISLQKITLDQKGGGKGVVPAGKNVAAARCGDIFY